MSKFGYFEDNGKRYTFTDFHTPRPMMNYLWNDRFLSAVNHFGGGEGAYGERAACYIDPEGKGRCSILRGGTRYFYLRDGEDIWNPGWYPMKRDLDHYSCSHGLGYTYVSGSRNGLSASLRVFVGANEPAEIWTITLKNDSGSLKTVKSYFVCDFLLEGYSRYSDYNSYVFAEKSGRRDLLVFYNEAQERPHPWFDAFLAQSVPLSGFESSRKALFGPYGSMETPEAIQKGELKNGLAACEKMAGALEASFSLAPGESVTYHAILGACDSMETAEAIADVLLADGKIEAEFAALLQRKEELCGEILVSTPEEKINMLTNEWLKQQVQLCAEAGRDTGKGFRDQLQDAWAIASFNPQLARGKIAETLRHQYSDGRCVRGWLPLDHHIYSDGPVWIAPTINGYLKETGDYAFLEEKVPYLDGGEATVWEHILLAARYSSEDLGAHRLVLAHDGDWNDSLNGIGTGGKGESVWTSIGLYQALHCTAEIAAYVKKDEAIAAEMKQRAEVIKASINENAWDGGWYLAAINDLGEPVGSHTEETGKIYLNSQTWAVMTGVAEGERKEKCLEAIDRYLDSDYGPLTLYPAYRKYQPHIGRLTSFVPGIWENGTPYCHGGAFKAVSDCCVGRGDQAFASLMKILPDSEKNPSSYSGCEPYALTNMYLGPENPRAGQTMFAWVTGTAGWIFRLVTQYMLGFHPGYESITLNPCIPSGWKECSLKRKFRGATYHISIRNANGSQCGVKKLRFDGGEIAGNQIPICGGGEHTVEIEL